jgi:hypothetical protein
MNKILHIAVLPVTFAVEKGHNLSKARIFKKKRHAKVAVGFVIMICGSALGTFHVEFLPAFLWHGVSSLIHAYGALPILKVLCEKWDLETIREVDKMERNLHEPD